MKTWRFVLNELEGQMTKATFNTHLANSRGKIDGDVLTVSLKSTYAVEWVRERLADRIKRTAEATIGRPLTVAYCVYSPNEDVRPPRPRIVESLADYVPGVDLEDKHFLKCPLFLPDVVGPLGSGAVIKLYIQVLRYTVGHFDEAARTYGREWWPNLTIPHIQKVAGLSYNSVLPAIDEGRQKGWLKWVVTTERPKRFNLALRIRGEPVDWG